MPEPLACQPRPCWQRTESATGCQGPSRQRRLSRWPGHRAPPSACLSCPVHSRVRPPAHGDSQMNDRMPPQADGLYDPRYEHDACGVAMVARLDNVPGHDVVVKALEALDNLEHRGAEGADIRTGDGAGLLMQLPHRFFRASVDFELPEPGRYGVCVCFLPATSCTVVRSRSCSSSTCASRASAS